MDDRVDLGARGVRLGVDRPFRRDRHPALDRRSIEPDLREVLGADLVKTECGAAIQ